MATGTTYFVLREGSTREEQWTWEEIESLCRSGELSARARIFLPEENRWAELGPKGARGCCSSVVYWNPRLTLALWQRVEQGDWRAVEEGCGRLNRLFAFLDEQFAGRGFTDTAYDRLGGLATGFLRTSLESRGPYPAPTEADVKKLAAWFRESLPEMLEL